MPDRNTAIMGAVAALAVVAGGAYYLTHKPVSAGGTTPGGGGPPNLPPPVTTAPGAPTNVRVQGLTRNSVRVTWDAVPGANRYAVMHPDWHGSGEIQVASTRETSVVVSDLAPNSPYSVLVTAANDVGWGPDSPLARGNTLP